MSSESVAAIDISVNQLDLSGAGTYTSAAIGTGASASSSSSSLQIGVKSDCETCILSNTASSYDFHIIVCDQKRPEEWSGRVEEDNIFVANLCEELQRYSASTNSGSCETYKITCCVYTPTDLPGYNPSIMQSIIVYPVGKIYAFVPTPEAIQSMVQIIFSLAVGIDVSDRDIISCLVPWENLFLVCAHAARDKRCGRAGRLILQTLSTLIDNACYTPLTGANGTISLRPGQIKVLPSSHIGGHKFAGTLIVYPKGDWFGHISKSNCLDLLVNVLNDAKMPKCFRGNGLSKLDF